jgi:hypothetical protein
MEPPPLDLMRGNGPRFSQEGRFFFFLPHMPGVEEISSVFASRAYGTRRTRLFVPPAAGLRIFRHSSYIASTVPCEVGPIVTGNMAMPIPGCYE